jgi:hypothetical protein
MKRMLLLSILLTGILSCSKNRYEGPATLPGKWKLTGHGVCGFAGCSYTRYTGPEISLTLYADNQFTYTTGTGTEKGTYRTSANEMHTLITFSAGKPYGSVPQDYYIRQDTLVISSVGSNPISDSYVKSR